MKKAKSTKSAVQTGQFNTSVLSRLLGKRRVAVGIVLLVVVAGGLIWASFQQTGQDSDQNVTVIPTEEQAIKNNLEKLLDSVPVDKATTQEKADYYYNLSYAQEESGNYQAAIDAFKQGEALLTRDLTYYDYLRLAANYDKVNNKAAALAALDSAVKLVPPNADSATGYDPAVVLERIDALRKRYGA